MPERGTVAPIRVLPSSDPVHTGTGPSVGALGPSYLTWHCRAPRRGAGAPARTQFCPSALDDKGANEDVLACSRSHLQLRVVAEMGRAEQQ